MSTEEKMESFISAFESILACVEDEVGHQHLALKPEQLKLVRHIYRLIVDRSLRLQPVSDCNLSEATDVLLYECEEISPSSATVRQLSALLRSSSIRDLFSIYDIVSTRSYSPLLPQIPFEVDDDDGIAVKFVRLVKGNEPLGATIKCNTDGTVYIARVIAGGVADRSGCIQVGDRVLEVNNVNVTAMSPTAIVKLLNSETGVVTFKLLPAETVYEEDIWANCQYVRAMIDYSGSRDSLHPCPESALCFSRGEILQLVVSNDEHWWQARSLGSGAFASLPDDSSDLVCKRRIGLIPSEDFHQRDRVIRDVEKKIRSATRKFSRTLSEQESLLYESVSLLSPGECLIRPIVLIGPPGVGRNELKKKLIAKNCEKFSAPVPHTSRPKRAHENDGFDYFFVQREQMEQWIRFGRFLEFGEYKNNLYGTLCDTVVNLLKQGRMPVLAPHPLALRVLRSALFKPFIIFIKPPDLETLKETRRHQKTHSLPYNGSSSRALSLPTRSFTDTEFEQMICTSEQLNQIYGYCFDMVVVNANFEQAFEQLQAAVTRLEHDATWVPSDWVD